MATRKSPYECIVGISDLGSFGGPRPGFCAIDPPRGRRYLAMTLEWFCYSGRKTALPETAVRHLAALLKPLNGTALVRTGARRNRRAFPIRWITSGCAPFSQIARPELRWRSRTLRYCKRRMESKTFLGYLRREKGLDRSQRRACGKGACSQRLTILGSPNSLLSLCTHRPEQL